MKHVVGGQMVVFAGNADAGASIVDGQAFDVARICLRCIAKGQGHLLGRLGHLGRIISGGYGWCRICGHSISLG
jgi:hypothetical protein